jgi:hypothetical protein
LCFRGLIHAVSRWFIAGISGYSFERSIDCLDWWSVLFFWTLQWRSSISKETTSASPAVLPLSPHLTLSSYSTLSSFCCWCSIVNPLNSWCSFWLSQLCSRSLTGGQSSLSWATPGRPGRGKYWERTWREREDRGLSRQVVETWVSCSLQTFSRIWANWRTQLKVLQE